MKGTHLGEFEELVLLAAGILSGDAYGLSITDELEKQTKRNVTISAVHKALVRLEGKGYLKSHMGGASDLRGGRAKKLYALTGMGARALKQAKEMRNSMWNQMPKVAWEGGKL